jgi:hypothetical protein
MLREMRLNRNVGAVFGAKAWEKLGFNTGLIRVKYGNDLGILGKYLGKSGNKK